MLLAYLDKNHDKSIVALKKTTIKNQLIKNLLTLTKDKREKLKDWESNNLNIALRLSKLGIYGHSAVLANNKVSFFF